MTFAPEPNFEPSEDDIRSCLNDMEAEFRQAYGFRPESEPIHSPGYYAARVEAALDQAELEAIDLDKKGFTGEPTARMVINQWRVEAFTELTKIAAHVMLQLDQQSSYPVEQDYGEAEPQDDIDPEQAATPEP